MRSAKWCVLAGIALACAADSTPAGSSESSESGTSAPGPETGEATSTAAGTTGSGDTTGGASSSSGESGSSGIDDETTSSSSTGEPAVPVCDDVTAFAQSWSAPTGGEYETYGILWPSGFDVLVDDAGAVYAEFVLTAEGQVVRKLDSDGQELWTWALDVPGLMIEAPVFQRSALRWLPDGDAIAVGYVELEEGARDRWVGRLDLDAQAIVWSDLLDLPGDVLSGATGVDVDGEGGVFVASMTETCCPTVRDTLLHAFTADGAPQWDHTIEAMMPTDVLVDAEDVVTVIRRDSMNFHQWTTAGRYVGPWSDETEGMAGLTRAAALDSQGRLVVSTMFPIDGAGNFIADVRRYTTELELEWRVELEGVTNGTNVHALAIDPDDAILYAHHYASPVTLYKIVDGKIVAEQAIEDATAAYGITMAGDCGFVLGGRNTVGETTDLWLRRYDPA